MNKCKQNCTIFSNGLAHTQNLILVLDKALACLEVRLHHLLDEGVKVDFALPA